MDAEEEENNSNPPNLPTETPNESVIIQNEVTSADTNTQHELASTGPHCEPEPGTESQPLPLSPASETEITVPDKSEDRVSVGLEVGVGEGVSESPPPLSPPAPLVEAGQPVQEVDGGEGEERGGLIGGEEVAGVVDGLAVEDKAEDVNNEMDDEKEEVVAAEVAEEIKAEAANDKIEAGIGVEAVAKVNDDVDESVMDRAIVVEKMEENEDADVAEEDVKPEEVGKEKLENTEKADKEEVGNEDGPTAEEVDKVKMEKPETADEAEEAAANEVTETRGTDVAAVAVEKNKEEEMELADAVPEAEDRIEVEEMEMTEEADDVNQVEQTEMAEEADDMDQMEHRQMAEEAEDTNEVEEMEMAEDTEGAEDEVEEAARGVGVKRKRGKNVKAPAKVSSRKKMEEDVCFICFDGGELVLCDRRGCPKAYHPSCVNRDEAFFRTKGRWNCGWHLCSNCEKNAHYMCYTCTFSLCKGCVKDAVILCVRGNKGFCETCMKTVMLIEKNEQAQVNFDDKNSWEYLFKDYWIDLKERLSITAEELVLAKNPWKGFDLQGGKQGSPDEVYDAQNDGGSGSDSSLNAEATTSKKRKTRKRLSRAKGRDSGRATVNGSEGAFSDESVDWASKELLEFVMHMKNGDKSVCSQFDVQALLLEYIKRNKLRDPRRKSQIICDSRLESLFGKPRVGHFEMLKLLESHFFVKDDSQADDVQGSNVDTEHLEADENSDGLTKSSKDKKRKSRKKGERRGLQSNVDDYAAIDMHNINLIYLRRSLVEDLIEDAETFHDKAVGSFVRIKISGSAQKQDLYRLVQVIGTNKAAEPYKVGKRITDFLLEILNLNKTEVISMDIISNQDFTEDECKRLRQSIKCGLINRLTVGDIQDKAMALQAVRVKDLLETEITRLSHLRDRASDMGRRKELRECVEKLQLLKSPEERQRRVEEIPEIHSDPKMDPSYESEEDEDETDEKRQENYLRPRGSGFTRRGREPVSPHKGSSALNDSWGGTRIHPSMNRDLSRSMSNKGLLNKVDDAVGASEMMNENSWSQGREKEAQQSQSWEKMKTASKSETQNILPMGDVMSLESGPRVTPEVLSALTPTRVTQPAVTINEAEKIWHYRDPSGKIQGPFSMLQLRKWNKSGYFPADLKVWRTNEKQDDAILLSDALDGNFLKDPPSVSPSVLKSQLVYNPHASSLPSGHSAGQASPTPIEVPKYSTDRWGSETNLPSPTPAQTVSCGMKNSYESRWSPTPSTTSASTLGANPFSGSGELQRPAALIPESGQLSTMKLSGRVDGANMSHVASLMAKPEAGMLLNAANAQLHSQSPMPNESLRDQHISLHPLPAQDSTGASVNAAVDVKSLQNLLQPMSSNNALMGTTHGWAANSIPKPDVNASQMLRGVGSQAWGSTPSQKVETNNSVSMPSQTGGYGNWGNQTTPAHNSASFGSGNPNVVPSMAGPGVFVPSDTWRAPVPGQQNIQPSTPSNVPWGMAVGDGQGNTPRQGPESQNTPWASVPGNSNLSWGGPLPPNSNQGWGAPGQVPVSGNVNPGWVAPGQGQAPGKNNPGWVAPVQGQAPGNAFQGWAQVGKGPAPAPVNANQAWAPPGNANPSWAQQQTGNGGTRGSEMNHNGERYSGQQRDRGPQGGDSGGKPWNRQQSFGRGDSSRVPFNKGQRVCKYHESGHCKKGAQCDYLHT